MNYPSAHITIYSLKKTIQCIVTNNFVSYIGPCTFRKPPAALPEFLPQIVSAQHPVPHGTLLQATAMQEHKTWCVYMHASESSMLMVGISYLVQLPGSLHRRDHVVPALHYSGRNVADSLHSVQQVVFFLEPATMDKVMARKENKARIKQKTKNTKNKPIILPDTIVVHVSYTLAVCVCANPFPPLLTTPSYIANARTHSSICSLSWTLDMSAMSFTVRSSHSLHALAQRTCS